MMLWLILDSDLRKKKKKKSTKNQCQHLEWVVCCAVIGLEASV